MLMSDTKEKWISLDSEQFLWYITHRDSRSSWDPGYVWSILPLSIWESSTRGLPATLHWQPSFAAPAQVINHIFVCVTVKKIFLFISRDVMLKNFFKEFNKTKVLLPPSWNQNKPMCCVSFYSWLYYFWNPTRLLSDMLNVKRKETPGKWGKPVTENVLLELGKHKEGLGEVSPPPPHTPKTQTVEHVEENYPSWSPSLFSCLYGRQRAEWQMSVNRLYLPYHKGRWEALLLMKRLHDRVDYFAF